MVNLLYLEKKDKIKVYFYSTPLFFTKINSMRILNDTYVMFMAQGKSKTIYYFIRGFYDTFKVLVL